MFLTNYKNVYVLHKHDRKAYPQGTNSSYSQGNKLYLPIREKTLHTHKGANSTYPQGKLYLPTREQTLPTHKGTNSTYPQGRKLPTQKGEKSTYQHGSKLPTHKGANSTYPQGSKLYIPTREQTL